MAWYNSSWTKRKPITLTGGASGAQTAYQVKLTVTFDSDMKSDFSDLRFTKADGTTLIDSWLESKTDSTSAIVWVETDTPAQAGEVDIYMYYGNSGAASDWDIGATFLKSDDFEDGNTTDAGDFFVTSSNYASTTQKKRGSYSSLIPYDTADFQLLKSTAIGGALGAVMIEADIYINTTTGRVCTAMVTDTAGDGQTYSGAYLKFEGGKIYQYSGGYNDTSITYTTGWHKLGILQHANNLDLYLDAQSALSITNYNSGQTNIDKFSIGDKNNPSGTYIDDVRVRKYVANPATYAFGSEETSSTGWTGKILGVTNPAKVFGIAVANISKVMGV